MTRPSVRLLAIGAGYGLRKRHQSRGTHETGSRQR